MKRKDLFMHSTEIEVQRTIGDVSGFLVRMGANQIMTTYDEVTRQPSGLYFTITVGGVQVPFSLPARIEPIYAILHQGRTRAQEQADREQARRVAWRQIFRWVQANLALIETGMVAAAEVFTPYIQVGPNETLYQRAVAAGFQKLLPASNGEERNV